MKYFRLLFLVTLTTFLFARTSRTEAQAIPPKPPINQKKANRELMNAARIGFPQEVPGALARGADINVQDKTGMTPLMQAVRDGQITTVRTLLERGANVHLRDKNGATALLHCVRAGRYEVDIAELLLKYGADINAKNRYGESALLLALLWQNQKVEQVLVSHGVRVGLAEAVCRGDMAVVRRLFWERATTAQEKGTALLVAISEGKVETTLFLLAQGTDANTTGSAGRTALMRAAGAGRLAMVRALVESGADVRARDNNGRTVLQWGIGRLPTLEQRNLLRYLIEKGADVRARTAREGSTALHQAADFPSAEIAALLLKGGADPNARDRAGYTPLLRTAWWTEYDAVLAGKEERHAEYVSTLIGSGAKPDVQAPNGMTALMYAAGWRHPPTVKALLQGGARVHIKDKKGRTALTWAAREGKEDLSVRALLEAGAKVGFIEALLLDDREKTVQLLASGANLKGVGPFGETGLMIAAEKGDHDMVETLLKRGLNVNARDEQGCTSLMLAIAARPIHPMLGLTQYAPEGSMEQRRRIVKILIEKGARVNLQTSGDRLKQETALMWAAAVGDEEIVRMLLAHGADVNAKDDSGDTALDYATRREPIMPPQRLKVVPILQQAGAKSGYPEP